MDTGILQLLMLVKRCQIGTSKNVGHRQTHKHTHTPALKRFGWANKRRHDSTKDAASLDAFIEWLFTSAIRILNHGVGCGLCHHNAGAHNVRLLLILSSFGLLLAWTPHQLGDSHMYL